MAPLNAFTVDVEDYYQVSSFDRQIDRAHWDRYDSRGVASTRCVLDLLDRHDTKATFFVLGWIGHRWPGLVREIRGRGHEIGSHGYWHRRIYQQSPEEFRGDVRQAREVLQDAIGEPVRAYRAPSFSLTRKSLWALPILVEEGFSLDSSVFPIRHHRCGLPGATPAPHQIATEAGPLWEFPLPVTTIARMNVPVGGGICFRLYPLALTLRLLTRINQQHERPFVFHVHPWELDPEQPRLRAGSWASRAGHYLNLKSTRGRLEILLKTFRFGRLADCLRETPSIAVRESAG